MPDVKTIYDSQDDIPESVDFRELFTEKNGKWELTGITGLKTPADVQRATAALENEKAAHKATREKLDAWGDLKLEDVRAKLDKYPELEAASKGKLDENEIEEIVNRRVEGVIKTKTSPLERQLRDLAAEREKLLEENGKLSSAAVTRAREDELRPLLVARKVLPEHHEDVFLYAERHLERDDEGKFFAKDGLGGITAGATPADWLDEMLEKRPGWLPPSEGGGARGSTARAGVPGGGKNPWTDEGWNMTEQGRILRQHGVERAEKLAKAAGTTVGGPRPSPKKQTA